MAFSAENAKIVSLQPGQSIGPYQVLTLIGQGGMGEVWQARDTKLDRNVALKVLPEAFTADPDRLARFEREAKVLASLNHPNIGSIYGLEESDGGKFRALVLELVEGPTLADRIKQGPIPLDEALPIAKQIAEALEAAHEQGVIHRDLKPANIKVKADGTVKVLDFGLAKAFQPDAGDPSLSQSPTISLSAAATQLGMVIGTAAYMAPEQAKGLTVDKRADIWAYGAVLFEMLTGRKLFDAGDVSEMLASVLVKDPDISSIESHVPAHIRSVVRQCLVKDPKERIRDIGDVRLAMKRSFEATALSHGAPIPAQPAGWKQTLPWVAGLALAVIASLAVWSVMRPAPLRLVRFAVSPEEAMRLHIAPRSPDVAISPTGDHVAYLTGGGGIGAAQLRVRRLDQLTSETLVATGVLNSPFFSPDGASVGFYDRRSAGAAVLQRVSVRGGPTSTICELTASLFGASWGTDGTIVFATVDTSSGLWRVPAVGGEPALLTTPNLEQGELDHAWPEVLPGGHAVLFTIVTSPISESQIAVLSLDTGEQKVLVRGGSFPRYALTGHLLYGVQGNLWAVGFDPDRLETRGDPVPVLEGVLMKDQGAVDVGLSEDGSLIYVPGDVGSTGQARMLVLLDREGREEVLRAPPAPYEAPRISPDGRAVAVEVRDPANTDVMVYDLERETRTRLTFDPGADGSPLWSPDGQRILFSSDRDGAASIYATAADGTGQPTRVTTGDTSLWPQSWSSDGQTLVIRAGFPQGIQVVSIGADGPPQDLIASDAIEVQAEVSPDGRWIAYQSNESGPFEVYVRPFPNVDAGKWQMSRDGGTEPVWGPDGRELFFRTGSYAEMLVVAVTTEPVFSAGNPEVLFATPYRAGGPRRGRPWDVAADGRFLMIKGSGSGQEAGGLSQINVVLNWHEELKRLVPVD